jgi:hypothetical protein
MFYFQIQFVQMKTAQLICKKKCILVSSCDSWWLDVIANATLHSSQIKETRVKQYSSHHYLFYQETKDIFTKAQSCKNLHEKKFSFLFFTNIQNIARVCWFINPSVATCHAFNSTGPLMTSMVHPFYY